MPPDTNGTLRKHMENGGLSFLIKLLAAAVAYGILLGQVMQIDARLARVEGAMLNGRLHTQASPSFIPPALAGERKWTDADSTSR